MRQLYFGTTSKFSNSWADAANVVTQDANGKPALEGDGVRALQLVQESLKWDPSQPLALHLHIHITEAGSPIGYVRHQAVSLCCDVCECLC